MNTVNVDIPTKLLLTIAVYGNMGDGELSSLYRTWAEKQCEQLGLTAELQAMQEEKFQELARRVNNVMGDGFSERLAERVEKLFAVRK